MNQNSHDEIGQLKLEIQRLGELVTRLLTDREKDHLELENMRKEWSSMKSVYNYCWSYTRAELERWGEQVIDRYEKHPEEFKTLSEFIHELQ
jgi:hypothetical protein